MTAVHQTRRRARDRLAVARYTEFSCHFEYQSAHQVYIPFRSLESTAWDVDCFSFHTHAPVHEVQSMPSECQRSSPLTWLFLWWRDMEVSLSLIRLQSYIGYQIMIRKCFLHILHTLQHKLPRTFWFSIGPYVNINILIEWIWRPIYDIEQSHHTYKEDKTDLDVHHKTSRIMISDDTEIKSINRRGLRTLTFYPRQNKFGCLRFRAPNLA